MAKFKNNSPLSYDQCILKLLLFGYVTSLVYVFHCGWNIQDQRSDENKLQYFS